MEPPMLKTAATFAFLIAALPAAAQSVSGTVTKIDEAQGKLTINHGAIKNLDMDAMTMVFRASDAAMLKGLKAGDKIKFDADRVNGQITVTKLQKAK
ncbi:RND transporter [Bosea thiooxidans]|uniref:RND transporter n=2 Tax=Bosea thiooxidans TaxID=53254 RepID=A0A0Q3T234_9HYPH|nr:RND transporter [Bosea thiooxidans]